VLDRKPYARAMASGTCFCIPLWHTKVM